MGKKLDLDIYANDATRRGTESAKANIRGVGAQAKKTNKFIEGMNQKLIQLARRGLQLLSVAIGAAVVQAARFQKTFANVVT